MKYDEEIYTLLREEIRLLNDGLAYQKKINDSRHENLSARLDNIKDIVKKLAKELDILLIEEHPFDGDI